MARKDGDYSADQIKNLSPRDHLRTRPSAYIGGTGSGALAHLFNEALDNAADEFLAGHCSHVEIKIHKDERITVADNGRGIPLGETTLHSGKKVPTVQAAFTEMLTGGKFTHDGSGAYQSSGGMNGMGAKALVYASREVTVEVKRDGQVYRQTYRNGRKGTPGDKLTVDPPKISTHKGKDTGTSVTFLYDDSIFDEDVRVDAERIQRKCYNVSRLCPGLTIEFSDERSGERHVFESKNGLPDFVSELNEGEAVLFSGMVHLKNEKVVSDANRNEVKLSVEFACQPAATDTSEERGSVFTNLVHNPDGGTHLTGFRKGLTRALNGYFKKSGLAKSNDAGFEGSDVMQGLAFVLSFRMPDPQYESQTKKMLTSAWVDPAVAEMTAEVMTEWLGDHAGQAKLWHSYLSEVRKARERLMAERKAVKAKVGGAGLDPLLAKMQRETKYDPSRAEIYFVEGDSAGGSARGARDRTFQAVLPFRGKMLNILTADRKKALENEDVRRIALAMETGVGQHFDIEKLRYNKIILMADADPDGGHIIMLWLTALWTMFPEIVRRGHAYIAMPPLYSATDERTKDKTRHYFYTRNDLEAWTKGRPAGAHTINRFKGLGEMDAPDLEETSMNPLTRRMRQVKPQDIGEFKTLLTSLMGSKAESRREYMDTNCRGMKTREATDDLAVAGAT